MTVCPSIAEDGFGTHANGPRAFLEGKKRSPATPGEVKGVYGVIRVEAASPASYMHFLAHGQGLQGTLVPIFLGHLSRPNEPSPIGHAISTWMHIRCCNFRRA